MPGHFLRIVEPASGVILSVTLVFFSLLGLRAGREPAAPGRWPLRQVALQAAVIAAGGWLGEVTCIRAYRFYQYDAPWAFFWDVMPALVVLIWPVVVLSARELVWSLGFRDERGRPLPLAVFFCVLLDASLVEAVAVSSKLWSWNEPGFFGVPWIGVLGWGFYAASVSALLDRWPRSPLRVVLGATILTHVLLLVTWWGALRWLPFLRVELSSAVLLPLTWGVTLALALVFRLRSQWKGKRADLRVMGPRIAAASLFLTLSVLQRDAVPALLSFALAFPWPYLSATRWSFEDQTS
jgi:hypothetical protein